MQPGSEIGWNSYSAMFWPLTPDKMRVRLDPVRDIETESRNRTTNEITHALANDLLTAPTCHDHRTEKEISMEPTTSVATTKTLTPIADSKPRRIKELLPPGGKRRQGIPGPS
jgi:hypothetical protein